MHILVVRRWEHWLQQIITFYFFYTSGSMRALLVPEILPGVGFCDEHQQEEQELGVLVVGYLQLCIYEIFYIKALSQGRVGNIVDILPIQVIHHHLSPPSQYPHPTSSLFFFCSIF